jgi:copper(I)-binding protein
MTKSMNFIALTLVCMVTTSSSFASDTEEHGQHEHHTNAQHFKEHKDHQLNAQLIEVSNAWVRAMPPVMKQSSAFFTLTNNSDKTITFTDAKSDSFDQVMIHQIVRKDDMVGMEPLEKLILGPKQSLELSPQGIHLMLMQRNKPLKVGDKVRINLCSMEMKTCLVIKVPVVSE